MKTLDIVVIAALALIAIAPLAGKLLAAARAAVSRPAPSPLKAPAEGWRAGWVQTLMELQAVLEAEGNSAEAVKMNRELIWLILGGDSK